MAGTFMNSAMVLSIGIFFSLIIVGLSSTLPAALYHGLSTHGVPRAYALKVSHLPPVGSLFAAFLGYNPMATTLAPIIHTLPHGTATYLTGHRFFPTLVSHPFATGIHEAFWLPPAAAWWPPWPPGCAAASTTTPNPRSRRRSPRPSANWPTSPRNAVPGCPGFVARGQPVRPSQAGWAGESQRGHSSARAE